MSKIEKKSKIPGPDLRLAVFETPSVEFLAAFNALAYCIDSKPNKTADPLPTLT